MSTQLQVGYQFSGTAPNNAVTAEKLNALVAEAILLPGCITEQTLVTSIDDGDYFLVWDASANALVKVAKSNFVQANVALAGSKNLWVVNNTGTPATLADVTADEVVMRASNGDARLARTVAVTGVDVALYSSGATLNGRDHASLAASGWLYLHAISDGTTDGCIWSASATSVTFPTGYRYSCLLAAVYYTAAALRRFASRDTRQHWVAPVSSGSQTAASLNNDPTVTTNYQSLSLSTLVPPAARVVRGYVTTVDGAHSRVIVAGSNLGVGAQAVWCQQAPAISGASALAGTENAAAGFQVPLLTAQTLFWKHSRNDARQFWITGYDL